MAFLWIVFKNSCRTSTLNRNPTWLCADISSYWSVSSLFGIEAAALILHDLWPAGHRKGLIFVTLKYWEIGEYFIWMGVKWRNWNTISSLGCTDSALWVFSCVGRCTNLRLLCLTLSLQGLYNFETTSTKPASQVLSEVVRVVQEKKISYKMKG